MMKHWWVRVLLPYIYLACAALQFVSAFGQSHVNLFGIGAGAFFIATAAAWGYVVLRGLGRQQRKVSRLREKIRRRYGDDLVQA